MSLYIIKVFGREWKIQHNLSFPKDKLGIIFLQDKMNNDIPINQNENMEKKLMKF